MSDERNQLDVRLIGVGAVACDTAMDVAYGIVDDARQGGASVTGWQDTYTWDDSDTWDDAGTIGNP